MGPDVPLLNDYKQEFFWKRFPQTVLGGPRFKLGYCAPPYVYLHQVALFLAPWLLGGVGTLLYQLRLLGDVQAGLLSGALMLVAGAALQGLAWAAARRRSARRTTTPPRRANHLHLADEEEEVEFTRCLAPETLHFVVPGKRLAVNAALHAVLAGTLCGLGTWYLLPDRLYRALYRVEGGLEAAGAGATVPVLALSWVTLCIAEYSLIVNTAAETATFQPQDTYEIAPLTRPMYILAFVLVDLALSCVGGGVSELEVASQVLHVVFVLLPVLWALGMLPPLDALLLWAMEQGLVHALGGSPMASNRRLVAMFLLSSCVAIIAFFIPSSFAVVLFSVAAGYLLSQDLTQVTALAGRRRVASSSSSSSASSLGLGWCWLPLSLLLLAGSVSESGLLHQFCPSRGGNSSSLPGVWKPDPDPEPGCDASALQSALGWLLIALLLATRALGGLQGACWGGGLFLNPLYPRQVSSVQVFRRKTRHLRAAGLARRVLLNLVSPFAMIAFLAVDSSLQNLHTASMAVGFTRAFRVVWQSSEDALLQMAVVVVLMLAPGHDTLRLWHQLGIGVQLVVVSLVCDRLHQFKEKLKFALTVLITSWTETKQRRQCAGALLALNAALWPLLLGVVLLCALLSAPLLPLFTLPVFLVAFPRPQRSWPGTPGTACPCPDSVYYQQLGARLAHALKQPLANGVLGSCSPGSHFLARFQDRVVWISVLEKGYGYCTLNVKGLELQETSCHTVEARRVDEVFEGAFDRLERPGRLHLRLLNPHWGNTLTPASAVPALVYSDSRNVLTGIIDSPDHLRQLRSDFLKALLWVLLRHCVHDDARTPRARPFQPSGRKSQSSRPESRHEPGARDTKAGADSRPGSSISPSNLRGRQSSSSSSSSSFADWSDDDDLFGPVPARKPVRTITVRTQDGQTGTQPAVSLPGSVEIHSLYENMAMASLPTLRPLGLGLGMPAVDLGGNGGGNGDMHGDEPPLVAPDDPSSNPSEPLEFSCPFSERLSLPPSWRSAPLPHARLQPLRSVFPEDWFRFCLARLASEGLCDGEAERVCGALQEDRVLREMYARVVLSCAAALGADAPVPSPSLVFRVYCGDGPRPDAFDWLRAEKELHQLTLRAFRYSVKLLIDQASLGPMESQAELYSTLQDYNSHWFIGLTTERGWNEAVLQEKPFLFSLGHDLTMGTYTGRVLWLQESALQLGVLNSECVRGQWANLAWELLYVTNDDEERYSMQAHPVLLRNLTVQAADPPLGYPVYSSPPLHLACL